MNPIYFEMFPTTKGWAVEIGFAELNLPVTKHWRRKSDAKSHMAYLKRRHPDAVVYTTRYWA